MPRQSFKIKDTDITVHKNGDLIPLKKYSKEVHYNSKENMPLKKTSYWNPDTKEYVDVTIDTEKGQVVTDVKGEGGWVTNNNVEFKGVNQVVNSLPPGLYELSFDPEQGGAIFSKIFFHSDIALALPGLPANYILEQIKNFWGKEEIYKKYGFIHKRGILLYGPPGCGKTSIIRLLCDDLVAIGGIIFMVDDFKTANKCIQKFREIESTRPIMTLMEDVEGIFKGDKGAAQIQAALSFLDGQNQINNIVHIATTNEPEGLADRFIKRPGRFDLVLGIHPPQAETREAYLKHICGNQIEEIKLKELVEKTEGLGLSYLRELTSTHLCLGIPLDETLDRLKKNFNSKKLKNKKDEKLGFSIGYDGHSKNFDEED